MNVRIVRMLRSGGSDEYFGMECRKNERNMTTTEEIKQFLDKLPDDIKKYIYVNFFELELKFSTVMNYMIIDCRSLTAEPTKNLKKYVKIIINNEKLKKMFLEKSTSFKGTYNYLTHTKTKFYNIARNDPYYNFALHWTMNQHH
jgi:hypothetical protein